MRIALVVGHDVLSKGAYGNMGQSEFDFSDELLTDLSVQDMYPTKHEYGIFYRSADIAGYTNKMLALHQNIDEWQADISIEFHFNSFSDSSAQGHEVLYCSQNGKKIAELLNRAFDEHLPTSNRGVKKVSLNPNPIPDDNGAGFCCRGKSYAIISEPFFGAHQSKFSYDGIYRQNLLKSFQDFFNSLEG